MLKLGLLGPFQLAPLAERCSRKGEWLLALLVLRRGREADRALLAGMLWPDTSEPQALYNLRRELTRLRRALGDEGERLRSPSPHTLTLDTGGAEIDVVDFDDAIARGDLEAAVALYRGPFLEGCTEGWAIEAREARTHAYLDALEALAARDLAARDPSAAVPRLRLAIAADPLRESAHRALMAALSATGAHAAATQAYRELRLLLERELHAEPSPETRALHRQLRAEAALRWKGERSTGTPSPEAAGSPPGAHGRVPRPLTPLVGRAAEVREITARVGATRLLTLTGAGGVGKSRLAVQVACDLADGFADGAWFVELAPLADPDLVAPAVASVLGVREAPGRPIVEQLSAALRDRQLLLVLDNCEHVLDAAGRLAERLLQAAAELRILATSRQSLGLFGEVAWRVPSLVEKEAIALFQERGHGAGAAFDVDTVAQICARLDGIPLAIELAAARTRALSVAQIAQRLDDRFRLLTGGSRTALPRHRTLKAAVDWGYQLLTDDEQALLRRVSVFAGGFSLEAAEAVAGGDVLDTLANLVDKSLVSFHDGVVAPGQPPQEGRYRLLETVREYAAERLAERGETEDARARHLDHFLRLTEAAEPHIFGGESDRALIGRLERENDNLRAAFAFCEADERRAESALRLVAALHWFWFARGHLREGRARVAAALPRRALAAPAVRARALAAAGYVAMWVGDYADMPVLLGESLSLARELGDRALGAYALCGLGAAATIEGDAAAARTRLTEAAALAREPGMERLLVFALYWLGSAEHMQRDFSRARVSLEEGLELARRTGLRPGVGHTLFRLGEVAASVGDLEEARRRHLESLAVVEETSDRWGMAMVLDALGRLAVAMGEAERGARLLGAVEALCEVTGASVLPSDRRGYDRAVANARRALGDRAFAAAWAEGRTLPLEQAAAQARGG
jgi:non-specific serine/threonine protein kinase